MEKQVNDAMAWMNNKMNQQNSQDLTLDPVVKVQEIQAKAKVQRGKVIIDTVIMLGINGQNIVKERGVHFISRSNERLLSPC